ncbi:MAG TPA: hypothetical protein VHY08_08695, partial [Bacillota bacterium]|nr:hypothetical protein [Bacillota bacterium]
IFLLCLLIAFRLLVYQKSQFQSAIRKLRGDYQALYLPSLLRQNRRLLMELLIEVTAISGVILFLWNWTSFTWYIPPEYIPDELIDFQYFGTLFQSKIREMINSIGYIPSPEELALNIIGDLSNLTFCVGIIGLFPLYAGLRRWRRQTQENQPIKSTLYGALLFLGAILTVAVIGRRLGLEVNPEFKSLVVVWVFLFSGFIFEDRSKSQLITYNYQSRENSF